MKSLGQKHKVCSNSFYTFYRIILAVVFLSFLDGFTTQALTQGVPDKKARQRARVDSLMKIKQSLSSVERKMPRFLRIIKRMKDEKAGEEGNTIGLSKKYSVGGFRVDDSGRIEVNVVPMEWTFSDTSQIVQQIRKVGGSIMEIEKPSEPAGGSIWSWIPYEAIEELARLPRLRNFGPGRPVIHSQ